VSDASPDEVDALRRENRMLARKLARLTENTRQLEAIRDGNATLLSRLMQELDTERARSRELLLNVLPQPIVDRLGAGETNIADRHDDVTVLFSDFVGFTTISSELAVAVLVDELNRLFSEFDALCTELGVEKIKTIGDAYLAVGGLDDGASDPVGAVCELALGMIDAVDRVRTSAAADWRIRIGIHAGPAVAGVIGTRKFVYDVWGDTVNVASRLESTSEPGRIHVSARVSDALEGRYVFEPRGEIELKGKGAMRTSFLVGRADALG
jgi:class 3 adenylate cyclase